MKTREGWKLVPIEPTEEMVNACRHYDEYERGNYSVLRGRYEAMLAAAPLPPVTEAG